MADARSSLPVAPKVEFVSAPKSLALEESKRFPRCRRLNRAEDYRAVFAHGRRLREGPFTLLWWSNNQQFARLGLAVSKRHLRFAHDRNRIKRLIRESFRQHQNALCGIDVVVLCQANIHRYPPPALHQALTEAWNRLTEKCAESSSS
ncbi:ribonuclease P protein component [Ectothiorhodosinus mongolicus]|uniref:ribonuclease P protein component n=1 Tax=Ectothiorhodosinus mongolicus TaxID=233100 RepID=UPI003B83905D